MLVFVGITSFGVVVTGLVWALHAMRSPSLAAAIHLPDCDANSNATPADKAPVPLAVRLATLVIDDDQAILALVPAAGCWAPLRDRPPATWGTLCVRLTNDGPSAPVLEGWRDNRTILRLRADGTCGVRLSGSNQDVWLALT